MANQQELLYMAENCDEYLNLNKGIISSVAPHRSCHTCYNSKNGVCDKEMGNETVTINLNKTI